MCYEEWSSQCHSSTGSIRKGLDLVHHSKKVTKLRHRKKVPRLTLDFTSNSAFSFFTSSLLHQLTQRTSTSDFIYTVLQVPVLFCDTVWRTTAITATLCFELDRSSSLLPTMCHACGLSHRLAQCSSTAETATELSLVCMAACLLWHGVLHDGCRPMSSCDLRIS